MTAQPRRATAADAPSIAACYLEGEDAVRAALRLAPVRAATLVPWFATLIAQPANAFFVEPDGFVQVARDEVVALYVARRAWGTGVAARLLAAGLDHLRTAGAARATLVVMTANARARRFYEREGWTLDGAAPAKDFDGVAVPFARYARTL